MRRRDPSCITSCDGFATFLDSSGISEPGAKPRGSLGDIAVRHQVGLKKRGRGHSIGMRISFVADAGDDGEERVDGGDDDGNIVKAAHELEQLCLVGFMCLIGVSTLDCTDTIRKDALKLFEIEMKSSLYLRHCDEVLHVLRKTC